MRIWVDLANSPHPLLFAPIARRLTEDGHTVLVTARDNAQTVELARERWPATAVIGGQSPKGRGAKARTLGRRVADLRRWASRADVDVALSHNSYAQILAARSLRMPVVTAMDFEHQPANHLAFRLAQAIILPRVMPLELLRKQGASDAKVVRYDGLKEELYIGDFELDPEVLATIGLDRRPDRVVVARTPPSRAVYHQFGNPLFEQAVTAVCADPGTVCVVLSRHPEQNAAIERLGLANCVAPRHAVDSRSLMYAADMMIGAGGTMTREAALMGTETWTLFAGETPAVDEWLIQQGAMQRLINPAQLAAQPPHRPPRPTPEQLRVRGAAIERVFVDATVAAARH